MGDSQTNYLTGLLEGYRPKVVIQFPTSTGLGIRMWYNISNQQFEIWGEVLLE